MNHSEALMSRKIPGSRLQNNKATAQNFQQVVPIKKFILNVKLDADIARNSTEKHEEDDFLKTPAQEYESVTVSLGRVRF